MSATTINVPADQVGAIRESLSTVREELGARLAGGGEPPAGGDAELRARLDEVERLLDQLDADAVGVDAGRELTGSRRVLWDAAYDSLCGAAERLADECNELWRGALEPDDVRARLDELGARLELLVELGSPPGAEGEGEG